MIEGGEDPKFIARRLVISASEDIGLANPNALLLANAAFDAVNKIGWPEGRIPLAEATVYLATSPKSNSAYLGIDAALDLVRRGGTVSLSGVYGGEADLMPMKSMFDKQISLRMGQCNVRSWIDDLLPLVEDPRDPLGVLDLTTHRVSLEEAPAMYEVFQKKEDGCIKVVLTP
jgi:threonine dehydrogenase-like Zn-dependent dehydrogenase